MSHYNVFVPTGKSLQPVVTRKQLVNGVLQFPLFGRYQLSVTVHVILCMCVNAYLYVTAFYYSDKTKLGGMVEF
ncbi:MAG: hypothetical protein LBI18_10120 [Planctomycetaceae bacterium]|nr:hypothetical protein [Planctomycetaceae bacterium]